MAYKIAIVDDDKNLLESLGYVLTAEGFAVDSYSNGEQALHGIRASSVDLAILDLFMPKVSGFKLFQKLKKTIPSLSVIFLTARQEDFFESSGLELGADDFVRKPCKNEVLLARINARIKKPIWFLFFICFIIFIIHIINMTTITIFATLNYIIFRKEE